MDRATCYPLTRLSLSGVTIYLTLNMEPAFPRCLALDSETFHILDLPFLWDHKLIEVLVVDIRDFEIDYLSTFGRLAHNTEGPRFINLIIRGVTGVALIGCCLEVGKFILRIR